MKKPLYEYTFVRFGEHWMESGNIAQEDYRHIIQEHAADGWRLVQIFAPDHDVSCEHYYELIFERPFLYEDAEKETPDQEMLHTRKNKPSRT